MVSLLTVIVSLSHLEQPPSSDARVITTALGETRSVTLPDGTIVSVTTASTVSILYTDDYRTIEVENGEALFNVKKDTARPFRVIAGNTLSQVVGTKFNVRYIDEITEIVDIEGTVAFERPGRPFAPHDHIVMNRGNTDLNPVSQVNEGRLILVAGEHVKYARSGATSRLSSASTENVSAWMTRRLIFKDEPLSAIASEFNRYNREKLVIEHPLLSEQRVSGVFSSDDPHSLVDFLQLTTELSIKKTSSEILIAPRQ